MWLKSAISFVYLTAVLQLTAGDSIGSVGGSPRSIESGPVHIGSGEGVPPSCPSQGILYEGAPVVAAGNSYSDIVDIMDTCGDNCCQVPSMCDTWSHPMRFYLKHTEGRWLFNGQGYTTFGFFSILPYWGNSTLLPFVDTRVHVFNNGDKAGNIGGGLRFNQGETTYGVNVYYDFLKCSFDHLFNQIGVGFERLNPCWDVRTNFYIPIGSEHGYSRKKEFRFKDGFRASCRERRDTMWGLDFEVGRWLICKDQCRWYDLYGAIGGYYYDAKGHRHDHIFGGDLRVSSHIGRFLTFNLRTGYDPVYKGMVQISFAFTVPLSFLLCQEDHWSECCCIPYPPVERNEILNLGGKECCWDWNWKISAHHCGH